MNSHCAVIESGLPEICFVPIQSIQLVNMNWFLSHYTLVICATDSLLPIPSHLNFLVCAR